MSTRVPHRARRHTQKKEGFLERLIDPIDVLSEVIFSILILLTFTLAFMIIRKPDILALPSDSGAVNELLVGIFGAILAWGVIDGVMYALISLFERGEKHRLLRNIQLAESDEEAVEAIADELEYILEPISEESVRQKLYLSVHEHLRGSQAQPVGFTRDDLTGALGHIIVAILAVLPSLAPLFLLQQNIVLAIRVSNIVSFVVLFIVGYRWGKYTGANPWKTGLLLTGVAVAMVLIAIPLGG